ncbi:tRNA pseudouridine(38-40) synthase TruA [Croceivirga sp. JEA036]|uniref:tRNA pseudouridine(38-40) synthase TruA n=1 Tax=Croceivirga sp. JEA036 TaxID=2721162 RepID=UPI00143B6F15|nr:tRNA pseudouridine(38-40) synthase TruA [Croceivirga sp. JEA036]NJB37381.1 tRNA pseudouridine(38-40) synthase TruA [Croceivirga sp. JEA036]
MRYFIEFSYHGAAYHGWQKQPNAVTVQQVLEEGLSLLTRQKIEVVGAGRTDAGVHAKQMYAHFDVTEPLLLDKLIYRLNAYLPTDIAVKDLFEVPIDSHARFDATERSYEYWVVQEKSPFYQDSAHQVTLPLNVVAMNIAAKQLIGKKDFECFSKSHTDVKTFFCDVRDAVWEQKEDKLVFTITADRFLRNMVRAVVGTLLEIGLGKRPADDIPRVLASKNRGVAGVSVPAKGLYLTRVVYPELKIHE